GPQRGLPGFLGLRLVSVLDRVGGWRAVRRRCLLGGRNDAAARAAFRPWLVTGPLGNRQHRRRRDRDRLGPAGEDATCHKSLALHVFDWHATSFDRHFRGSQTQRAGTVEGGGSGRSFPATRFCWGIVQQSALA